MTLQSLLADPEAVGAWTLDPNRSSVRFTNKTLWGLIPVNGRFTDFTGKARIEAGGRLTGRLEIKAASVRTGIGMRDKHLRDADFFDAENYPDITVQVTGPDDVTLTIRGNTLPLPLRTEVFRLDDGTIRISGQAEIDRTTWGVSGNMAGMMPTTATVSADAIFTKSQAR